MSQTAQPLLFWTQTYAYLSEGFLKTGAFEAGHITRKTFPDHERYLRVDTPVWGRDVVLLGGTPTDIDWLELYDLAHAMVRGGARSLSITMPFMGYSTMERATKPGEVVTAFTRARLLASVPECEAGSRIFLFDLHTDGIEFYYGDTHVTRHLYGAPLITQAVDELMADQGKEYILGATDAGRAKWVQSLARDLGVTPAFVYKERDYTTGKLNVTGVNAQVQGRHVVIYDDMIRTGSSLLQAAHAYLDAGAAAVHAITSHLVLPNNALDNLRADGALTTIMGSNSHPSSQQLPQEHVFCVGAYMTQALKF